MCGLIHKGRVGALRLAIALALGFSGCEEREAHLEDMFLPGGMLQVSRSHWEYRVEFSLRKGVDPTQAAEEIEQYLRHSPTARKASFPGEGFLETPLQSRHFWALVLAKMRGWELRVRAEEGPTEIEHRIQAMLGQMPARDPG